MLSARKSAMKRNTRTARVRIALALLATLACSSDSEARLELARELALRWYQMNQLDRAEEQVVKALDIDPEDPQMRLLRGWIRQQRGTRDDILIAEQIFRDLDTTDYRARLGLAAALERKGVLYLEASEGAVQTETAERAGELRERASAAWLESAQHYEDTLALSPGNARALVGLQRVYTHLGDVSRSLEYAARHREVVLTELEFNRELLSTQETSALEEKNLRQAIRANEDALIANTLLAAPQHMRLDQDEQALAILNLTIEVDPKLAQAHSLRAQALERLGRPRDALDSIERFLELSTELDYDHPDIQTAYRLKSECEHQIRLAGPPVDVGR